MELLSNENDDKKVSMMKEEIDKIKIALIKKNLLFLKKLMIQIKILISFFHVLIFDQEIIILKKLINKNLKC